MKKTLVLKSYEDALEKLGAVQFYEGGLSAKGKDLIEKEKLAYFKDLSENYSATYKQFVLKTINENIWFELFIVGNENEIRLSYSNQTTMSKHRTSRGENTMF